MKTGHPIAVFDIDGTIFRSVLFAEYVQELEKLGAVSAELLGSIDEERTQWLERAHAEAFPAYMKKLMHTFDNYYLQGVKHEDHEEAVRRTLEHKGKFVYTYTRDLARELKQQGYTLIAISGSPQEAIEAFGEPFEFDIYSGLRFGRGAQTLAKVEYVPDRDKAADLRRIVAEHGLSLQDSIGVGDTASDISMLALVDRPIAFNPTRQLFEHAKEHGWKIVIERKNMIYELASTPESRYQLI
jgi:HAD superfamily hydrolase (TIGR01490 family)